MGFVVTEEMTDEFKVRLNRNFGSPTMLTGQCYQDALQCLVDRHNLAPASAVEEVDDKTLVRIMNRYHAMDCCPWDWAADMRDAVRSLGLRIVRDAKPAASFGRRTPPLNLPDDDGFCSVGGLAVDLGLYKSSDAKPVAADDAVTKPKQPPLLKVGDPCPRFEKHQPLKQWSDADGLFCHDCQAWYAEDALRAWAADDAAKRDAKDATIAELRQRTEDLTHALDELVVRVVALESRNPEPETVTTERTFTEAEVRAAMRLLKSDVAIRHIFDKLGINLEADA